MKLPRIASTRIVIPQWIAGAGVMLLLIHVGLMAGWTSPALARLTNHTNQTTDDSAFIVLDEQQASWVASLLNLGRFAGAVIGPVAVRRAGSKTSILLTLLPIAAHWLLIGLANSAAWLYAARISGGLGLGMAFSAFPLFVGEVAMNEIRGALVSLATLGAPLGQVIASVCGAHLSMTASAALYFVLSLLPIVAFAWLPESPHHLARIGKREACRKAISWYRAGAAVEEELAAVEGLAGGGRSFADEFRDCFSNSALRTAFLRIIALFALMQLGGLNVVMFYMESILIRANFELLEPSLVVACANACSVISAGLSIGLIDRCGRRFLLLVSSAGTTLSMLALTLHFLLQRQRDGDLALPTALDWLPACAVCLFMLSFFVGLLPVPSAILGETFPDDAKCVAACVAILTGAAASFISAKTYQWMLDLLGDAWLFAVYALMSALVVPFVLCAVAETKGKSLQQIQDELARNSK